MIAKTVRHRLPSPSRLFLFLIIRRQFKERQLIGWVPRHSAAARRRETTRTQDRRSHFGLQPNSFARSGASGVSLPKQVRNEVEVSVTYDRSKMAFLSVRDSASTEYGF
jgi:hypothetical protein